MASTGEVWRLGRRPALDGRSLADAFDPRSNAIGFLRLAFAVTVVVSHAWPLGGFGADPGWPGNNPGILAVDGFFALSGFLITASAARCDTVARFLWHRLLRIMPGFWCALLAIVLLFVPAATGHLESDSVAFLWHNLALRIGQSTIGRSLAHNPFALMWTGPMYTLVIEFGCYLLVAVLATRRLLRPAPLMALAVVAWLALFAVMAVPVVDYRLARFTLAFLVGAVIWSLADRIPTGAAFVVPVAGLAVAVSLAGDYHLFALFGVPAYVFLVVWAGAVLPLRGVGTRRDLSYGVYLYGWPVEQVLAAHGLNYLGLRVYLAAALLLTMCLAVASWHLVESRALRFKAASLRSVRVERDAVKIGRTPADVPLDRSVAGDVELPEAAICGSRKTENCGGAVATWQREYDSSIDAAVSTIGKGSPEMHHSVDVSTEGNRGRP